ncbi:MAG: arsenate reductase ArsC [Chloroflexota bacterium]
MTAPGAPIRVLVVCTGNAARSQMAEAFLARIPGIEAASAGTHPAGVHPLTIRVLAEAGIDWSGARSKSILGMIDQDWDLVLTVCDDAREACPVVPGAKRTAHEGFPDPAAGPGTDGERLAAFLAVRDGIAARMAVLAADLLAELVSAR